MFSFQLQIYLQTLVSDLVADHLTVNISSINYKDRPEYSTVETNDEYLESLSIQPDFVIINLITFITLP